jgi:hypothetical protein
MSKDTDDKDSNDVWSIDDRPDWELSEEEWQERAEEAERILGPERCKQIDEEFAAWLKENKKELFEKIEERRKRQRENSEFVQSASFLITHTQLEQIRPYMPNVDNIILNRGVNRLLYKLNEAIVSNLGKKNHPTKISKMLQKIYDEISDQNK